MVQVKICGINDPEAFDTAIEAGADWLGFVFFPRSPRYVTPKTAAGMSARSRTGPPRVGLFVKPTIADIQSVLDEIALDILQVYAAAPALPEIWDKFHIPVWRPVGIGTAEDLPEAACGEDRLLIEAKPPENAERPGGNATAFDWAVLRGWRSPTPWVLAGGLTPINVASAISLTGAEAVDVSSGVERAPGIKDARLIRQFIEAAKRKTA